MKQFVENERGWYAVVGDNNIVITNNKDLKFEFQVTSWFTAGEVFVGIIKKGY